jgi:hypothetical protein
MGIVTQASLTALRELKYEKDLPGGGSSGEPYITQKLPPAYQQQYEGENIWLSDSGLIRGGFTGAAVASSRDFLRIGKFLKDAPRGPLFIAKQIGLQLSNPQLETTGVGFRSIGPTRIYNLGINTLAQVPVNAFGGHIVRHGLTPILNEGQLYSNVVVAKDAPGTFGAENRLVVLKAKLQQDPNANIAQYISGPGSISGIGTTTIRRYSNTLNNPQYSEYGKLTVSATPGEPGNPVSREPRLTTEVYPRPNPAIDYYSAQGVSERYFQSFTSPEITLSTIQSKNDIITGSLFSKPKQIDQNVVPYDAAGRTYNQLIDFINTKISGSQLGDSFKNINTGTSFTYTKGAKAKYKNLPLNEFNIENRIRVGGAGAADEVNKIPLFESSLPPGDYQLNVNGRTYYPRDLIKFRIEAVNGSGADSSVWMVFRALLKDIVDNPNPTWSTVNYTGRGESFYIYKGFERTISFSFQVAAMSEAEMKPMWQKLNYLYSNTMPEYTGGNSMNASYMKLTIGDYIFRQPGVIKSLTYTIDNKSPWEIAIDDPEAVGGSNLYELPQVMNVQMTFAVIHDFLPQKMPTTFDNTTNASFADLPAFVVDRLDNQNEWLTSIYSSGSSIPRGNAESRR